MKDFEQMHRNVSNRINDPRRFLLDNPKKKGIRKGSINRAQSLDESNEKMTQQELERPILAVDVVLFAIEKKQLHVLLHYRKNEPFKQAPALPGVAVRIDETLSDAAYRALIEKTGWVRDKDMYLEQLASFDGLYRDPRGRTVTVAHMGLTREKLHYAAEWEWKPLSRIRAGALPFDHDLILKSAVARLRGKLRYTNIAKEFLPETFRIENLQEVYEAILDCTLNRTNFRNKLLKIDLIEQVRVLSEAVGKKGGRPPHLYRFTREEVEPVDRDFL